MSREELLTKETNFDNTELGVFINDGYFGPFTLDRERSEEIFSKLLENNFDIYGHIENNKLLKYKKTETGVSFTVGNLITDEKLISKILNNSEKVFSSPVFEQVVKYKNNFYSVISEIEDKYFEDWDSWSEKIEEKFENYCKDSGIGPYSEEAENLYDSFLKNNEEIKKLAEPKIEDYKTTQYVYLLKQSEETSDYFENDTFIIRPYFWGNSEEISSKANFEYKPTGFKLKCYKYFMRGATCNKEISLDDFEKIVNACVESIK